MHQWAGVACGWPRRPDAQAALSGADYTLAVDRRCNVWAWGNNGAQQLGVPVLAHVALPAAKARTLTIARGRAPARTISIGGRNERNYQPTPRRLHALKTLSYRRLRARSTDHAADLPSPTSEDERAPAQVSATPADLRRRAQHLRGLYEPKAVLASVELDAARRLGALLHLAAGDTLGAVQLHCEHATALVRAQIDDCLALYAPAILASGDSEQSCRVLLSRLPVASEAQFEGALLKRARAEPAWCHLLARVIIAQPDACRRLSADLRLDLLELLATAQQQRPPYLEITHAAVHNAMQDDGCCD